MRKLPLLFCMLAVLGLQTVSAQCTPDPIVTFIGAPGVFPTPVQGIASGTINQSYSQTFTLIVPQDTTIDLSAIVGFPVPPISVSVNYFEVGSPSGFPAGISTACDLPGCQWLAGVDGCILMSGTPTQAGTFPVDLDVSVNVDVPASVPVIGGTAVSVPIPGTHDMEVSGGTGIEELNPYEFSVAQNGPNPFDGTMTIHYNAPHAMEVSFEIVDLTGAKVYTGTTRAGAGTNSIQIDAASFSPGVYFYTLSAEDKSITHKMIVQ